MGLDPPDVFHLLEEGSAISAPLKEGSDREKRVVLAIMQTKACELFSALRKQLLLLEGTIRVVG